MEQPILTVTEGPGQGIAVGVGLAISQSHMAASYQQPGFNLFSHSIFVICRGGALCPGVASEACSLAGHLQLSSLVLICCDDGQQGTENTAKRFEAYGWTFVKATVGSQVGEEALVQSLTATSHTQKPTLIMVRATASAPGPILRPEVCQDLVQRGSEATKSWLELLGSYREKHPEEHKELERRFSNKLPEEWRAGLPEYAVGQIKQATRQYSAKVLHALVDAVPEMIGGSADLTGSNLTNSANLKDFNHSRRKGRYIRFGVREHSMIGICTGLAMYGGVRPFCSTFMNFFTYGWGAMRLACRLRANVIYVATHDSIELGEDGPTHQPIEVLPACRALQNLLTIRPADGQETVGAYEVAMEHSEGPVLLALCRSGTPHLQGSGHEKVALGGYILMDFEPDLVPAVVLAASGTEVHLCVEVREDLQRLGMGVRVVSMPSWELFERQSESYRKSVFEVHGDLAHIRPMRVYVEASSTLGFARYADVHVGMTTFGASADGKHVKKFFGFERHALASRTLDALKERGLIISYKLGRFGHVKLGGKLRAAMDE